VVKYDEKVSPEELKAFWAEHSEDYKMPEVRSGRVVICENRETADKAHAALVADSSWRDVLGRFDCDVQNKKVGGRTGNVHPGDNHPAEKALYSLETIGQISEPFRYNGGRWAVLQLSVITPPRDYEMTEVAEAIGGRIRKARQDEAFAKLLEEWAGEFGVQIHKETLADLKSWEELTNPELPDNLVPRS
jgi:hypothetical protein